MKISSYPKVLALGKYANVDWPYYVEEKLDGSQISFGVIDGELEIRSKGAQILLKDVPELFAPTVSTICKAYADGKLTEGWIYRGEAIKSNRHNVLTYDRIPKGNLVLFDIQEYGKFLSRIELVNHVADLGCEVTSLLYRSIIPLTLEDLNDLLNTESMLEGVKVEGVVFKPTERDKVFGPHGPLIVKYVSEKFKEKMTKIWGAPRQAKKDIVQLIASSVSTEARWRKAVQHLEEEGNLEFQPRDIPKVIAAVQADILDEEVDYIRDKLWEAYRNDVLKASARGIATWYKDRLVEEALEGGTDE